MSPEVKEKAKKIFTIFFYIILAVWICAFLYFTDSLNFRGLYNLFTAYSITIIKVILALIALSVIKIIWNKFKKQK